MSARNLLRWLVIAGFGGSGFYFLTDSIRHSVSQPEVDWVLLWFLFVPFILIFCSPFFAAAYFILRRQYQRLGKLISGIAAVAVLFWVSSLIRKLDLEETFFNLTKESGWVIIVALPASIAALVLPFYAAALVYRRAQAMLSRWIMKCQNAPTERLVS